jgi:predicted transcriptional regulator
MPARESDLADAELEVLSTLWDEGPCTVRAVMNHLRADGRRLAYTTVLTFLSRLEQKGFVTADKSDVAYVYRPAVSREQISQSRVRKLLEVFFDGAPAALVLQLMREGRFSADEIAQLQRLIDRLDGRAPRQGRARR